MNTKALRQKILDLAIHGKLVPQDPNDEPASVLLEHIRAEKERLIKEGKIKKPKKSKAACDKPHYPFELPNGWKWCYIIDVTNKITDGTHNSPINTPKGDFKYITAKNIKAHGIELNNISYVSKNIHNEIYARCNPEKGDILYIKDGATTGVVTLNNLDEQFSLLSSVALIKPNKNISNKYLLYYLQSPLCYDSVRGSMKGVGITRITLKQIEKWELPLPPLSEQERIVCQIENWLSLIDTIEKGKENISIALKQAKSKILDLAIHGKLVPQDPNDEPARELLKRINPKAVITCDNPQYGKLPKGWILTKVKDVFSINPKNKAETTQAAGFIPMTNICEGFKNQYSYETKEWGKIESGFTHFADGDIAVAKISPCLENRKSMVLGNLPNGIGAGTTELHVFRPLCVDALYGLYFFKSDCFIKNCVGTFNGVVGQQRVGKSIVKEIHFPLPPLTEQHRIVTKIEELFAQLDKIEASL